jgi:hypothetical protein
MRGYGRGERGLGNARRDWDLPTPIVTSLSSLKKEEEETKQQSSSTNRPFSQSSPAAAASAISSSSNREDDDVEMQEETFAPYSIVREQQQHQPLPPQPRMNESLLSSRPTSYGGETHAHVQQKMMTTPAIPASPYEDDNDDDDDIFVTQILPMKRPPQSHGNIVQQQRPPPPPPSMHLESLQQQQKRPDVNASVPSSFSFSRAVERPIQSNLTNTSGLGNAVDTLDWFTPRSSNSRHNEMHSSSDNTVSNPPSLAGTDYSSLASVTTNRSIASSTLMPPPPPVAMDPNSISSSGNPFDLSTNTAKKYNYVPKSELHCLYGKRRKVISSESYHTWHNGGQAHSLKWTSIFVCPITGELFVSGRYSGGDYTTTSDGTVWYSKKLHAEHAAAARVYDCMTFRYPTLPLSSSVESLGQDIPYAATGAMFTVPPGIPSNIADKIRIQQNTFRNENSLPPLL